MRSRGGEGVMVGVMVGNQTLSRNFLALLLAKRERRKKGDDAGCVLQQEKGRAASEWQYVVTKEAAGIFASPIKTTGRFLQFSRLGRLKRFRTIIGVVSNGLEVFVNLNISGVLNAWA